MHGGIKTKSDVLLKDLKKTNTNIVIFTGGEPLMHDLSDVCSVISSEGYKMHLETSGSYPLTGNWDWITLSPKKIRPPLSEIYAFASELKVVIYNQDDFKWAVEQEKLVNPSCLLYLQPEWSKLETIQSDIIEFISRHPRWKLSLQTHKYLNIK